MHGEHHRRGVGRQRGLEGRVVERLSGAAPSDGLSPLVEVERAVQERAKATSLDMSDPSGITRLRSLIEEEVRRWSDDHKRGLRPYDLPDPELVIERAHRNLAGYGPLQPLLEDDNVWEIMINAPDQIFIKRHQGVSGYHDESFHERSLAAAWRRAPTDAEVDPYWRQLVELNRRILPDPANPDLIHPELAIRLPAPPPEPAR